jgi:outer membrane protein OmpA-like peptidoglycan-associated protein
MRKVLVASVLAFFVAGAALSSAQDSPNSEEIDKSAPPGAEDIINKLQPRPRTRGIKVDELESSAEPSINLYLNFELNSDRLGTDAQLVLRNLGLALKDPRVARYRFLIVGHTDVTGHPGYNQWLSERRARAVVNHLIVHYSIDPKRLRALGYGSTRLLDPAKPASGVNRRVQIINEGEES